MAVRKEHVQFSILGPLEVSRDGVPITPAGHRQRHLLAALLLQPNRVVSTDRLFDAVWQSEPPATARTALQVHVSQLRKVVGADAIETHPGGYLLRVDPAQIDATRFERLLAEARSAGDTTRTAELLRAALALVRGPALADLADEPFARAEAVRLDGLCVTALEERIDADLAGNPRAELIGELEALVAAQPLRERPRALLMRALYQNGRQADALAAYREARQVLVDELGIEPGPELRELERSILTHNPSLGGSGEGEAASTGLPAPPTPLIGRERELEEIAALVLGGQARLITLTGPGGIGKTRLAIELARNLSATIAGSVAFVPLSAITDPLLVLPAIAQALDHNASDEITTTAALVERLGERAGLLVVDNFEQVASARLLLAELVAAAPLLTVVVTSRAVLHLSGEHEYPVPPLDGAAAVRLFIERARAAVHRFDPHEAELDAVAKICVRLDGLPLAIELAAARTQLLSPAALLSRLGNLDVLAGGARDTPQRHRTLRATIDWSLDLLSEDEQRLFARLSVFVGGWTLEQAEAVCGAAILLDGFAALVDNSLVQRSAGVEPRFSMLGQVRDYALERLAVSPDGDELRRRHAGLFVALAETLEQQDQDPNQRALYEHLEIEHANIRAALAFLLETGEADQALRLAVALRRFWQIHGHLAEGRRLLEAALSSAHGAPDLRAKALNGLGIIVAQQGDFEAAARLFAQSMELSRGLDDPERVARALSNLGNVLLYQGNLDEARAAYVEAADVWIAMGDRRGRVTAGQNIANLDLVEGRYDDAFRRFDETIALAREHGDALLLSGVLHDYARGLIEAGRLADARAALGEAYPVMREFGHMREVAGALELYAAIATADSAPEFAAILFGTAARIRSSIGATHRLDQTDVVERTLGSVRERLGEQAFDAAFRHGQELPLERATGLPLS